MFHCLDQGAIHVFTLHCLNQPRLYSWLRCVRLKFNQKRTFGKSVKNTLFNIFQFSREIYLNLIEIFLSLVSSDICLICHCRVNNLMNLPLFSFPRRGRAVFIKQRGISTMSCSFLSDLAQYSLQDNFEIRASVNQTVAKQQRHLFCRFVIVR